MLDSVLGYGLGGGQGICTDDVCTAWHDGSGWLDEADAQTIQFRPSVWQNHFTANSTHGDSGSAVLTVSSATQLQGELTQSLLSGIPYHAAGTWSGSTCLNSAFGSDVLDVPVLPDGHIAVAVDTPADTCG